MINHGRDVFHELSASPPVDFIYGSATAVFDECDISQQKRRPRHRRQYAKTSLFGFVFVHVWLTGDSQPWIDPQGA